MATSFPSSLDSFTNPSASDALDSVSVPHADQHANINDAVEALQAKVGVDGSAVASSLDYKVDVALPRGLLDFDSQAGDITVTTSYTQLASVTFTVATNRYVLFTFVIPNIDTRSTTNRIDYYITDNATNASWYQRVITAQTNTTNSHANGSLIHSVASGANTFYLFANTSTGTARVEASADRLRQFAAFDVGPS
jgi:hypothetical protein